MRNVMDASLDKRLTPSTKKWKTVWIVRQFNNYWAHFPRARSIDLLAWAMFALVVDHTFWHGWSMPTHKNPYGEMSRCRRHYHYLAYNPVEGRITACKYIWKILYIQNIHNLQNMNYVIYIHNNMKVRFVAIVVFCVFLFLNSQHFQTKNESILALLVCFV